MPIVPMESLEESKVEEFGNFASPEVDDNETKNDGEVERSGRSEFEEDSGQGNIGQSYGDNGSQGGEKNKREGGVAGFEEKARGADGENKDKFGENAAQKPIGLEDTGGRMEEKAEKNKVENGTD